MAKPDLGTKRICPETGRKFYDLNKDPIVSPYTGQSYPLSYFATSSSSMKPDDDEEADDKELDTDDAGAELVSLEDADAEIKGDDDLDLDDDVDLGDDDDTFLADDEEDEDDVSGMISVGDDEDEA